MSLFFLLNPKCFIDPGWIRAPKGDPYKKKRPESEIEEVTLELLTTSKKITKIHKKIEIKPNDNALQHEFRQLIAKQLETARLLQEIEEEEIFILSML